MALHALQMMSGFIGEAFAKSYQMPKSMCIFRIILNLDTVMFRR